MQEREHAFKNDYSQPSKETVAETGEQEKSVPSNSVEPPFVGNYTVGTTQTPPVGKVYGTSKPHRVIVRGKISRD
jgi:hypothetical protein